MNVLRKWLRRFCLTADQRAVIDALEAPVRWVNVDELTPVERGDWAKLLATPTLRKIDQIMINLCCDEAQRALVAPTPDTVKQAGFALGYRAGWQVAKSLSTIGATEGTKPEGATDTGAEALAHLNP